MPLALTNSCPHQPWLTEFWLFLALISNANASILLTTRFFLHHHHHAALSYIASVLFIISYRSIFAVKISFPIAIDLCTSLLSQFLIQTYTWEIALYFALVLNLIAFNCGYMFSAPMLRKLHQYEVMNPNKKPDFKYLVGPLPLDMLTRAMISLYIFQGILFLTTWFFPFGEKSWVYWFYQVYVGCHLVGESVAFLKCYWELSMIDSNQKQGNKDQKKSKEAR